MRRTRRLTGGMAVAVIATLAACGDDDDQDAAPAETAAADTAATASDGTVSDDTAMCDPFTEVSLAFNGEPDDPAALMPLLDEVEGAAPAEIGDAMGTMVSAARTFIESQGEDFSAFESVEFVEAEGEVGSWVFEHCPFDHKVEVSATEFAFTGLGAEVPAGRMALLLTNDGQEAHEIAIAGKAEGTTESWDELLALPEDEGSAKIEDAGGAFAGMPGSESLMIIDLEPGDYIALCFIPGGTSMSPDGAVTEGTGVPHHVAGMRHEFTVA